MQDQWPDGNEAFFDAYPLKRLCDMEQKERYQSHLRRSAPCDVMVEVSCATVEIGSSLLEEIDLELLRKVIEKWCGDRECNSRAEQGQALLSLDTETNRENRKMCSELMLSADCKTNHGETPADEIKILARHELLTLGSHLSMDSRAASFSDTMRRLASFECTVEQQSLSLHNENDDPRPLLISSRGDDSVIRESRGDPLTRCSPVRRGSLMVDESVAPLANCLEETSPAVDREERTGISLPGKKLCKKEDGIDLFRRMTRMQRCLLGFFFSVAVMSYLTDVETAQVDTLAPKPQMLSTALTTFFLDYLSIDCCNMVEIGKVVASSKVASHTSILASSPSSNALCIFVARPASPTAMEPKKKVILLSNASQVGTVHQLHQNRDERCCVNFVNQSAATRNVTATRSLVDPRSFSELFELHANLFDQNNVKKPVANDPRSRGAVAVRGRNSTTGKVTRKFESLLTIEQPTTNSSYHAVPGWLRHTVRRNNLVVMNSNTLRV